MLEAADIAAALDRLNVLHGRSPQSPADQVGGAFATLARFGTGAIFTGSFQGESDWERHRQGDELVHVLGGAARLTVLTPSGRQVLELRAGMLTVVPQGCWHRFEAPEGVTLLTATPEPTDHTGGSEPPPDA